MKVRATAAAFAAAFASHGALAQTIDRVRTTDAQLTCAQLHAETVDMDKAATAAKEAEKSASQTATAGTVGNAAAEVAQQTGMFGQIGGLAGALFGKAATQTAAGVATQSGQQAAAQAQERARQAGARKEHVATLFLAKGCKADDLAYEPPSTEQSAAAVRTAMAAASPAPKASVDPAALQKLLAPAPSISAMPELDPDAHFKGQMGGTFGKNVVEVLPNSRRVAVTGFRVVFITENTVSAQVRASYLPGRDTSGARSTLNVKLSGVDAATLQAITDKVYADFLAQLRFAGREVVGQDELQEFFGGMQASGQAGKPYEKSGNGQSALVFAPAGMPLWFSHVDGAWSDKGPFDQGNHRRVAEYSAKLKAIAVSPLIVVNFAAMSSSGNQSGLTARRAETGAALNLHVAGFSSTYVRSDETRGGLVMGGDEGNIQMAAPIASSLEFGSMKELAATDNAGTKGIFDQLGRSMGMANAGGAARSRSDNVAETTPPAYAAAAFDALGRATGTFAKWFAKYPAK